MLERTDSEQHHYDNIEVLHNQTVGFGPYFAFETELRMLIRHPMIGLGISLLVVVSTSSAFAQSGTRGGYSAPAQSAPTQSYGSQSYGAPAVPQYTVPQTASPSYASPQSTYQQPQGGFAQPYNSQQPVYGSTQQYSALPTYASPCSGSNAVSRPVYNSYRPTNNYPVMRRFFGRSN